MSGLSRKTKVIVISALALLLCVGGAAVVLSGLNMSPNDPDSIQDEESLPNLVRDRMSVSIEASGQTENGSESATATVSMPDLSKLMYEVASEVDVDNGEAADENIVAALKAGNYDTIKVDVRVDMLDGGDGKDVDEDAIKDEALEKELINAVNSVAGEQE